MARLRELAMLSLMGLGVSGMMYAQEGRHDRDDEYRNRAYNNNNRGYEDGLRQGQRDRERNSRHNYQTQRGDSSYRDAYRRGYEQGYNQANGSGRYPYPNGTYNGGNGRNQPYGNQPYGNQRGYSNQASNVGFQDGRMDGQNDRLTGHSYRPTEDSNYKHADRGYSSAYGSKDNYKQEYRNGYVRGYQQGYGNQGGYRR